jgi:transposase
MDFIGIDLHKTSSQVCILTADGELIERRIKTDRESFDKLLGERPPTRILVEASTESEWAARHLEALGHEVIVADLGLVPREYSSGERQHRGRISKAGSSRARSLLVEAAWSLLRWKTERTRALHEWYARIAQRRGKATAVVALARKLAGIMFAVWRDGTQFDPQLLRPRGAPAAT